MRTAPDQVWMRCDEHDISFKTRSAESLKHGACKTHIDLVREVEQNFQIRQAMRPNQERA